MDGLQALSNRQRQHVPVDNRQFDQFGKPLYKRVMGRLEGRIDGSFVTLGSCWVGKSPMRLDRVAGPNGANFACRVVAYRDNDIDFRRAFVGKFIPLLERSPSVG